MSRPEWKSSCCQMQCETSLVFITFDMSDWNTSLEQLSGSALQSDCFTTVTHSTATLVVLATCWTLLFHYQQVCIQSNHSLFGCHITFSDCFVHIVLAAGTHDIVTLIRRCSGWKHCMDAKGVWGGAKALGWEPFYESIDCSIITV